MIWSQKLDSKLSENAQIIQRSNEFHFKRPEKLRVGIDIGGQISEERIQDYVY